MLRALPFETGKSQGHPARCFRPQVGSVEHRSLLSFADGNGAVVTAISLTPGSNQLVITIDGPLTPGAAEDLANYQVTKALAYPELVTMNGPAVKILSASYSDVAASQVTLMLKNSLQPGVFYRVFINGTPASMSTNPASNPLTDIKGNLFDGDNDDTPGGDFYGLFALGKKIIFVDENGARVSLRASGGTLYEQPMLLPQLKQR
jgi:hypothetical protein